MSGMWWVSREDAPMTREQAIAEANKIWGSPETQCGTLVVQILEKLGLVRFDEPKGTFAEVLRYTTIHTHEGTADGWVIGPVEGIDGGKLRRDLGPVDPVMDAPAGSAEGLGAGGAPGPGASPQGSSSQRPRPAASSPWGARRGMTAPSPSPTFGA
jgi:hypothetical protein